MIQPLEYKGALTGKSKAYVITFSDGHDYVVKFMRQGFRKVLANEWIAYCLARFMELPVPYSRIVEIPEDFLQQIPDTSDVLYSPQQFASLYIPGCVNLHEVTSVQNVVNREQLASIIVVDYWLCNRDRTRDNVLLSLESNDQHKLWVIDHGDIFESYNWTVDRLQTLSTTFYKSSAHKFIVQFIDSERNLMDQFQVVRSVPRLLLEEIVAMIPNEWLGDEEREAVVRTLIHRRDKELELMLRRFIAKNYRPLHSL